MEISIIILCLVLASFFSGMEIAFVSANKIYLQIEKKQAGFLSRMMTRLTADPSKFITSMLIGQKLALIVFAYYAAVLVSEYLVPDASFSLSLTVQVSLLTLLLLLTVGLWPRVLFQTHANSLIRWLAVPAYAFYLLFQYPASALLWLSRRIAARFKASGPVTGEAFFTRVELGNYITEQMTGVDATQEVDSEILIFQNALVFSGVRARDVMSPRTEIAAVELSSDVSVLRQKFIETDYSKILVYRNTIDDIAGYVHSFDLFREPKTVASVLIKTIFVPQTMLIKDVLSQLTKRRKSVAVVLDEYGGTAGILTVEDIIEELFGEIEDEHDLLVDPLTEQQVSESEYVFSARLDVAHLNQKYDLGIPESDAYATLGGFIVSVANEIPKKGAVISHEDFDFRIEAASNKKIELVRMTLRA